MGCGIVQVSEEGQIVQQVALATEKWFSSTRAELVAILVALLITPNEREVEIKTDSKAAILAIERGLKTDKARQWLRIKNSGLVAMIVETIKTKKLKLQLTKIKSHSGDFYNDLADVKAKEDANSTELFIPTAVCSKEFKLRYKWKNENIEKSIRSFVKMIGKVINRVEWTFSHGSQNKTHQERKSLQHWPVFYKILESGIKQQNYISKSNTLQLFELKCINNMLPVLESLSRENQIYTHQTSVLYAKKKQKI